MIVGMDTEYSRNGIDVLGLAFEEGRKVTAVDRNEQTLGQFLNILRKADVVVTQNGLDSDCRQLAKEGIDISWLEPKIADIRLMMHAVSGHLAGSGSFDLRSIVLLTGSRQGERYPLDFKQYESDLHRTCAMDAGACLWCYHTLGQQVTQLKLDRTVAISHAVSPILARMREQGVRLDKQVLEQIYNARKEKTAEIIEKYHLWEERGKKKIKKVPIWRSDKILDIFEQQFNIRPKDRQRKTWDKLLLDKHLTPEAKEFAEAIISLGRGANDAHWLGKAEEGEDGVEFGKISEDGFIFPRYDICGSPDRATTSSPSIQNWPRPGKDDPRIVPIRSAVIPLCEDHLLLEVDFSSVETYTNAIEMGDWDMVRDVQEKRLSHESTAAMLNEKFGLSLNRQGGKTVRHAADKGESPWNLACRLFNTERPSRQQTAQCREIFEQLLAAYPKTAKFRDDLWERSMDNPLIVTNSFGRRLMCFSRAKYGDANERYAKHDPAKKYWCSCAACAPRRDRWKFAIAFLGRSAAFDVLLRKMSTLWYDRRLDAYSLPYLEVHDSLAFSVPKDKAELYFERVKECFREPVEELGGIALQCEGAIGQNWAQCK